MVTSRSAAGVLTSIAAVAWSFELSGSGVVELAEATLVSVWPAAAAAAWTVIVAVAVLPAGRVPTGQVTTAPAALQPAVPETNVSPAGRVSVIVGVSAGLGPLFTSVSVKLVVPPGPTEPSSALFWSWRSAAGITSVLIVSAALAGSGSRSFESDPGAVGHDRAGSGGGEGAGDRDRERAVGDRERRAGAHDREAPPPEAGWMTQVKPGAVTELGVNEGGSGSSTRTLVAVSGPLLLTARV